MGAIERTDLKNDSTSDIVELNGAKIEDFSEAFLKVQSIESRFNSVKQSQGSSSSLTFSFLLNLLGSL